MPLHEPQLLVETPHNPCMFLLHHRAKLDCPQQLYNNIVTSLGKTAIDAPTSEHKHLN